MLRPFVAGDALAGEIAAHHARCLQFSRRRWSRSARTAACRCSSCFTAPRRRSRISARASWRPACSGCAPARSRPLNILVATSGDTGGAVAAAFHRRPGIVVSVLFPKGLVSPTQERQLTCWGDNVHSFRVSGSFDDCQRLVKEAFVDAALKARFELSSAEQHQPRPAAAAGGVLRGHQPRGVSAPWRGAELHHSRAATSAIRWPASGPGSSGCPSGASCWRTTPTARCRISSQSGEWRPRPSVPTLASAMDVGTPSNMERLRALFPDLDAVRGAVRAESVTDAEIQARITADFRQYGKVWCPHTATAAEVYARMSPAERADGALDPGLDRTPGEISRNRGAAHRATNRNAGKPC